MSEKGRLGTGRDASRSGLTLGAGREGERVRRRLGGATAAAMALVLVVAVVGAAVAADGSQAAALREQVLVLNGVRADLAAQVEGAPATGAGGLADAGEGPEPGGAKGSRPSAGDEAGAAVVSLAAADAALAEAQEALRAAAAAEDRDSLMALAAVALVAVGCLVGLSLFLYRAVVRPFLRLEAFAERVAVGDLDAPLAYERGNPFGRFAWAFDHLRTELKRSREAEAVAAEAHKTALASLSHDLRTPLASLRTYAEALELGLERDERERAAYERIIMAKCDEAAGLVEDLLVHALADMGRIEVACEPTSVGPVVARSVAAFAEGMPVRCCRVEDAVLCVDGRRLGQAVDNLLANAMKYAPKAEVEVAGEHVEGAYRIVVRDFGEGALPEELPFLRDRFYRGANAGDAAGAGLGLFIVDHLVERMGGSLHVENAHPGFRAVIELPMG